MRFLNLVRRPRNLVALVALVGLVAVAAAWLVPPLGTGYAGVASGPKGGRAETGVEGQSVIYYVPGGRVAFGMVVVNTTFLPVTLVGLVDPHDQGYLLDGTELVLGVDPNVIGLDETTSRAFQPVTLAPGEEQLIGVAGTFPPCADARQRWSTSVGIKIESLRFEVRVAGLLPAEADVPLLQALELRGDADAACP